MSCCAKPTRKATIWGEGGEHCMVRRKRSRGTYTCCAEEHCGQHLRQTLALKVLHMSAPVPTTAAEVLAYNLALNRLAHLLQHLFRHGGGVVGWRRWSRNGCDQDSVLPLVAGVVSQDQPSAMVAAAVQRRCGQLPRVAAGIFSRRRCQIQGANLPHPCM